MSANQLKGATSPALATRAVRAGIEHLARAGAVAIRPGDGDVDRVTLFGAALGGAGLGLGHDVLRGIPVIVRLSGRGRPVFSEQGSHGPRPWPG